MPNQPPAVRRVVTSKVTKKEFDELAPPLKRMAAINRAADKYKWSGSKK